MNVIENVTINEKMKQMSIGKEELLKLLKQRRATVLEDGEHDKEMRKKADGNGFVECSELQKEFWHRWYMMPESVADNIAGYVRIKGELSIDNVKKAFIKMIARHDILKTQFVQNEDGIYAKIGRGTDVNFEVFTDTIGAAPEEIMKLMRAEAKKKFDLSKGGLIRLRCYKVDSDEWNLLMILHHAISDGFSTNILIKEMLSAIIEYQNGMEPVEQEIRTQFYDYIDSHNHKLRNGLYDMQKDYWKKELKDGDFSFNFPESVYKNTENEDGAGRVKFNIQHELRCKVESIAKQHKITPFSIYMTAFRTLLYKYTYQDDMIIVTPVQGRNSVESEKLIGCFLNMLPVRNKLSIEESFLFNAKRENGKIINAMDNQDVPFGSILKMLDIKNETANSSVYHVLFSYEPYAMKDVVAEGYDISFDEVFLGVTKSDLVLELNLGQEGITGWFEFRNSKFSENQISLLKDAYIELLRNVCESENTKLQKISILSENDKELVLRYGTERKKNWEIETITEMFKKAVNVDPNHIAILSEEGNLTYKELDDKSNQMAHMLKEKGIGQNKIVALLMDKSPRFIISLIAVIKAGGAYLPIEPSYPTERINYMLEDSGAVLAVCDESYAEVLERITCEQKWLYSEEELLRQCDEEVVSDNTINSLAYVIYTSGTTGKPKGVMIEHRGVCNLVKVFEYDYNITGKDVMLQFAHIVFDASVWEIVLALLTGASLAILKKEVILDIHKFTEKVKEYGVTFVEFPPQFWKRICHEDLKFRVLLTAGSEADETVIRTSECAQVYINGYGPTENTVAISLWDWEKGDVIPEKIPIGKPIYNTQVYLLENDNLCGVGVVGEICVGGTNVARGYMNRPELTAAKFIENKFGEGLLYRTGDYGRWMEDGSLEFIGRIDKQVKIRGYRVEIGEIENQISKYSSVDEVAVLVDQNADGEKILEAYIKTSENITVRDIDTYLNARLPFYMIPSKYYKIEEMPVTINGKTDYDKLMGMGEEMETGYEYVPPRNDVEKMLVEIWSEVLNNNNIGVKDSFFECGGDSILILQVISKAEKQGMKIELKSFFEERTIENIAKTVVFKEEEYEVDEQNLYSSDIESEDLDFIFNKFN